MGLAQTASKYKVLEELPSPVASLHRFRAQQVKLRREVEIRLSAQDPAAPGTDLLFTQELEELARLDHPCFLPVEDVGELMNRAYYTVPLRADPTLASLLEDTGLTTRDRFEIVDLLADAVAACHARGILLGAIRPELVAVSRERPVPYFLHHRYALRQVIAADEDALPPDCRAAGEPSHRADAFAWAWLAYRVMTKGKPPYPSTPLIPLRHLVADVPKPFGELVETCLAFKVDRRPAAMALVSATLRELRTTAFVRPQGPEPKAPPVPANLDEEDFYEKSWVPEYRPAILKNLRAEASPSRAIPVPKDPAWPRALAAGTALAAVVLALLMAFGPVGEAEPFVVDPGLAALASSAPPKVEALKASAQARYKSDPEVLAFVAGAAIDRENFLEAWKLLRRLALAGRLPEDLGVHAPIAAVRATFDKDPALACVELERLRASLAQVIGYQPPSGAPARP